VVALELGDGRREHDLVCRHARHQAALTGRSPRAVEVLDAL
jgi:hypothetical protein